MATNIVIDTGPKAFSGEPAETYFARFGTFMLRRGPSSGDPERLHDRLVSALREDNRVKTVVPGSANHEWTLTETKYPTAGRVDPDVLLSGSDHFHSVRYTDAIMFEVFVPAKNQPVMHGEIPVSDSYLVAWDGYTAVVLWECADSEGFAPMAAGQVVGDILKVATAATGSDLYVQACSPECDHLFAHRDMRVRVWLDKEIESQFETRLSSLPVDLKLRGPLLGLEVAEYVHDEIKMPAAEFAGVKNTARRILDLERAARSMAFALIEHDYATLQRSKSGMAVRIGFFFADAWKALRGQSRSREASLKIASLWLAMASIETLQQSYRDSERQYKEAFEDWATPELFDGDFKSDEANVASIDPQFARAAIEYKSARMDNRVIVWATVGGAGVGALIAAAAGGLFT